MADVTACLDKRCPSRTLCYRYTCKKDEYRQSYWKKSPRKEHAVRCEEFWSNGGGDKRIIPDPTDYTVNKQPICRCDMFAMPHKRNEFCDTHSALRKKDNLSQKHTTICDKKSKVSTRKGVKSVAMGSTVSPTPCDGVGERSNRSSHPKRKLHSNRKIKAGKPYSAHKL